MTDKIHTKLHPGPQWRIFHVLASEDVDVIISRHCTAAKLCQTSVERWRAIEKLSSLKPT